MTLLITTERLVLRRFAAADAADLLACVSDPSFARATPEIEVSEAGVRAYIQAQNQLEPFELDKCFDLAIALAGDGVGIERKGDGAVIGLLSFVRRSYGQDEIGYALGLAYRGRGYATEAARALLAYAFAELGLHRVQATTSPANQGSWRVMERLGMRLEGRLREASYQEGEWTDVLIYGLLAYLFARWLGGTGDLSETLGVLALAVAPQAVNVLTLLPFVQIGNLVAIWGILCAFVGIKTAHKLSWQRALWATLLPFILVIAAMFLASCLGVAVFAAMVKGA